MFGIAKHIFDIRKHIFHRYSSYPLSRPQLQAIGSVHHTYEVFSSFDALQALQVVGESSNFPRMWFTGSTVHTLCWWTSSTSLSWPKLCKNWAVSPPMPACQASGAMYSGSTLEKSCGLKRYYLFSQNMMHMCCKICNEYASKLSKICANCT